MRHKHLNKRTSLSLVTSSHACFSQADEKGVIHTLQMIVKRKRLHREDESIRESRPLEKMSLLEIGE